MVENTVSYAIATLALFGVPALAFCLVMKNEDDKGLKAQKEKADYEFIEKNRQQVPSNRSNPFRFILSGPRNGIWHSHLTADRLLCLIEANYQSALIGVDPYRLTEILSVNANELILTGSWTYPRNPDLTTVVVLTLQMRPTAFGKTSVSFKYRIAPDDDPFANQIVEITNYWLKNLLEEGD